METQTTAERIAENESIFRDANERIEGKALEIDTELEHVPFICECGDETCVEIVRLRLEEYESVRTDATHFVIVPGHEWVVESTGTGHVIRTGDRFLVVAKTGRAAEVSEERDPRS